MSFTIQLGEKAPDFEKVFVAFDKVLTGMETGVGSICFDICNFCIFFAIHLTFVISVPAGYVNVCI